MEAPKIVIDTNVIASAMRSSLGTSYALFMLIGKGKFELNISVPLVVEYEKALLDPLLELPYTPPEIAEILDYVCAHSQHREIYYLWRPFLKDPSDDMVLEAAVSAGAEYIVTFNRRDFRGADSFGIRVVAPKEFLNQIGVTR